MATRGAPSKSLIMYFVALVLGDAYSVGRFKSLNSFNRESLIINSRVISFPDANPKNLDSDGIDFLKSLAGRNHIHVEHKYGASYELRSNALVVITNNEDFYAVPAYRSDMASSR